MGIIIPQQIHLADLVGLIRFTGDPFNHRDNKERSHLPPFPAYPPALPPALSPASLPEHHGGYTIPLPFREIREGSRKGKWMKGER